MKIVKQMAKLVECDVLWDHPDKTHATRLIIWLAWGDKIKPKDMLWFKPCLKFADVCDWDTKGCYGEAAAYGRYPWLRRACHRRLQLARCACSTLVLFVLAGVASAALWLLLGSPAR